MSAPALPARVQPGQPAGGQFTATVHAPADVALPAAPAPEFDADFETVHGKEMTAALQALPKVQIRDLITASRTTDLLRDSYPEYWADGTAPATRRDALDSLHRAFPHIDSAERFRYVDLIRWAVHNEMKGYQDPSHVLNPEHPYEVLITTDNYADEDELVEVGNDENRQAWATLADTAAFHAITADNAASTGERISA